MTDRILDPQPGAAPTAREAATALIALLDSVDGQHEFASLSDEVFWSIRGNSRELSGRLYATYTNDEPLKLLERWRDKFGGTVQPTGEKYTDNWAWYALTTEVDGVPLALKVPVPQPDIEQELRARIAELEAELKSGGGDA